MPTPTRNPRPPASDLPPTSHRGDPTVPRPRAHPTMRPPEEDPQPTPGVAEPARAARPRPAGSIDVDQRMLVIGYLSTVASRLDQRGFLVRALHAQEPSSPTLWGSLTLDPRTPGSGWAPARLHWEQDSGWSATMLPEGGDQRTAVARYLPGHLVPAPVTVAHFVAALHTDADTVWACATFRPPRRVDRRWLILQLARFAMPEPW